MPNNATEFAAELGALIDAAIASGVAEEDVADALDAALKELAGNGDDETDADNPA
jgi:hypothetical protein